MLRIQKKGQKQAQKDMNVIEWHKMDYLIFSAMRMRKCHLFCTSSHHNVPYEQQELSKGSEPWNKFLARACAELLICPTLLQTWAYHMEKLSRRVFYIYGNWYFLWVELSGWMGSVSYGLRADLSLPPCLSVTIGIWTLAHKSDPWAEISGEIVWYDALAPRPLVLLSWCFVCACATSL